MDDKDICNTGRHSKAGAALALVLLVVAGACWAGPREQARRMYDRLTGTPPSPSLLDDLQARVQADGATATALYIIDPASARSRDFYSVTLKNFATPWTNRDRDVFASLNDYTATVIGMVRDDEDFRGLLYQDILYVGDASPPYSPTSNAHYESLEASHADLRVALMPTRQSALNGLPPQATAGVMTSRAAAASFFIAGTNRAMFRFTLLNHLCRDLEQVHDVALPPDRIRQDVSRSPGGDSSAFNNNCIGCHNGMDPLAQAFAYYDFDAQAGRLVYTPGEVQAKYLINAGNFKPGYVTPDDRWENRYRLGGQNTLLGWSPALPGSGQGAKSMGEELAHSQAFAQCQVEKVFRAMCLRSPSDAQDRAQVAASTTGFSNGGGNLKQVFAETAAYCAGD